MAKGGIYMDRNKILKKHGATDIERYCLISNFGSRFKLNGISYDARFWANCYGAYIGMWQIHLGKNENADKETIDSNVKIIKKIQAELNENECD